MRAIAPRLALLLSLVAAPLLAQPFPTVNPRNFPNDASPADGDKLWVFKAAAGNYTTTRGTLRAGLVATSFTVTCTAPLLCNGTTSATLGSPLTLSTSGGSGTVTSVAQTVPSWLAIAGSPVTTSGTLAITAATGQTPHRVIGTCGSATSFGVCAPGISDLASSTSSDLSAVLSDETGSGHAVFSESTTLTNASINQTANGDNAISSTAFTATSPSGNFAIFRSAIGVALWQIDIAGILQAGSVPVARVTGLAASATTDATNASNVGTGTLAVARGGTGTGSTLTGLVRGSGSAMTAAELSGDASTSGSNAVTVSKINGVSLAGLGTGILRNTTGTGAPSIASPADFPSLNQNTSGSAASLSATNDVPHGGTGVATLVAHGVVVGNGTSAVSVTGAGTAGQILTSNGASADPTFQSPASAGIGGSTGSVNNTILLSDGTGGATAKAASGLTFTGGILAGFASKSTLVSGSVTEDDSPFDLPNSLTGTMISNRGAAASVTINLPTAPTNGTFYYFSVRSAHALVVQAAGGDVIRIGAAASSSGGTFTSSVVGSFLVIVYESGEWNGLSAGTWVPV